MGFLDGLKGLFSGSGGGSKAAAVNIPKRFVTRTPSGQGSMSKVYRAYDSSIGRDVCLKILDKIKTAKFEERFKAQQLKKPSEGEVCMSLRHPNVVQTFEFGKTTDGEQYLVMEWIDGHGLNTLIENKSATLNGKRVDLLKQLCDAIEYLHGQKYLHRDLCPRNIMVGRDGVLKLIDFGLTIPYTPAYCGPGNRTGTADYLAAEIIKRMPTDHRVDVFALGVTAFEVLSGQLPWERSLSSEDTLKRHLNTPPRVLKELNPEISDALNKIIMKALEKDARDRWPSVRAMRLALDELGPTKY